MISRMSYPMRDAPLIQLRFLCNGNPARYAVELTGTLGAGGRELEQAYAAAQSTLSL